MPEKRMPSLRGSPSPKAWRPAKYQATGRLPILQQIDQCVLVIVPEESWFKGIQLIPYQVMKGHSRVLRRSLNKPIERMSFLNLKPIVAHSHITL
jgi:hypothetical protein